MSNAWEQRLQQANAKASTQGGGSSAWEERLRQAEAASASQMETAANQAAQERAETINQIASANPYSVANLGPSPLQSNVQLGARASRNPYSDILTGLSQRQEEPQARRAADNTLAAIKADQLGLPSLRNTPDSNLIDIDPNAPLFAEQARKKQAEETAKEEIAGRQTSDFMESVKTGEQQPKQTQPSRNLLAVNVAEERARVDSAEKMRDQIKQLQDVVDAYDATGIYDDRYAAYKFTLDEAQKEYDRLYPNLMKDQEIDQAEKLQRLAQIESVQGNADYWGKTQYDPTLGSVSTYNPVTNSYETTGDLIYDYVNDRNGARGIDAANAASMGADLAGLDLSRLRQMSADERRVYNYLYNTNGKEQADEYLQLLSSDLNARQMEEVTSWWRDYADEHPVAASAASVVMSPMRGLSYIGQASDMAMINQDEEGYYRRGLDQNEAYNRFTRIPSEIRTEVSQNIENKWGKAGSFLYQTGMSMADFITNAALSGNFLGNAPGSAAAAVSEALSLTIMGTGAAADATIAAKERGLTDEQSFALGTIAGVAEILTEKVSMDSLLDLTHMDRNMIGYLLKNTLAEGSEEVGSDFINLFADIIIAKDESEWAKSVQDYKDLGMEENQAFWAAFADQGKQMGLDFLGGAISGLAMASGSVSVNQAARDINTRRFETALSQLRAMDEAMQLTAPEQGELTDVLPEMTENLQETAPENLPAEETEQAEAEQNPAELAQQLADNGTDPAIISAITGLMPDENGTWTTSQPTETEQTITDNGGLENEVSVYGGSERNDGARAGEQSGPVAESTGRAAENVAARARELGAVRAGRYAAAQGEVRSTADLGIQNGIESKTLREVPYTADAELENIHMLTQAMGVDTVFLDHKMQIRNNGRIQNITGAYDEANNRIIVCVTDARHSASALTMHEMYHAMVAANRSLTDAAWSALENDSRFGEEYMKDRLLKTIEAYRGIYGTSDEDLAKYKDEVIADIYGGLNRGTLEVPQELQDAVMEVADRPNWMTPGEARAEAGTAEQMFSSEDSIAEDSEGNTLTPEQQEYFKNSVVRDESGRLLVMYHGTPNAGFTEFRSGTYFTPARDYADVYQNPGASSLSYKQQANNPDTYQVYLNITKPFDTRNETERQIFDQEYYRKWGTGAPLSDRGLPDWTDGMDLQEFIEEMGYDYDGLILDEGGTGGYGEEVNDRGLSYVVFSPEQVKNIDNQNPTDSPDIRFSMAEPVEETGTLIALHNLDERKAREMLKLGGIPAPSIAIVRATAGHDNFGNYSVVFPRETIDPRANRKNRVYGSDAWTPTAGNARVEYPINRNVDIAFNNRIDELSSSVAGGLFRSSNILGSIGIQNDTSDMSVEDIARRLEGKDAIRAAYLADTGRNIEPVVEEKQWNRTYGNEYLRRFIDAVGPVRLAQIEANFIQEMPMDQALGEDAETIRKIMWDYYRQSSEAFVRKQAKARGLNAAETEAALDRYANRGMAKVNDYAIEDFARDAWAYYEDNGNTKDQINKIDTLYELERATQGEDVQGWLEQQLQGLLGEPGVYNGRDIFTPSGSRRSFAALHNPYTAEGIVKAMYGSTSGARGQNTFGTGATALMSVATPEYRSVDDIHADEGRLQELEHDDYYGMIGDLDDRISDFIKNVRRINKAYSDNSFEEENNIGTVLMDNAGKRTVESIRRGFAAEGYTLTPELAEVARSIYAQAAEIPTKYFEAKPERVVNFDEVLGVVAPDNAPEDLLEQMRAAGMDVLTYQHGNSQDRLEKVNSIPDVRFSVEDETEEELPETQDQQTRAQAEAMTQAQLEQRLKTDREQMEKYNLLRSEGLITPELENRAQVHEEATRVREQVLAEKRKGNGDNIDTQVDLTIRVGRKENARNLLRNLEQRKSALSMLPKSQHDTQMMADLNAGIERLKNHLREQNRSARQEIRKQKEETARNVRANESRTTLRDELLRSFSVEQGRRGQIGQLIDDFATRIQEQGRLSREDRNRLFDELLNSGAVRVIEDDYAAEIRNQLTGTRIYVPQEVRDEWKGDFNEFRKRAWGAGLYLTSNPDDRGWDVHNAELAELYPGAFTEDETDPKIALENMLSAAENGKPINMSLRDWLMLESGGSEEGAASALKTMMDEMDAALNRFAGAQKIEIDMKARSIMEEAREALAMQERADRIRENRELSELQRQTMDAMRQLSRLRRKTSNANRAQIDAVIGNIDLLARHISPEGLENLQALEREYQARKEELGANFIPNDYVEERLGRLSKRHVSEMDADELRELGRVVSGMITSIKNAQQMIGEENARMIADVATEWQDEVSNSKGMATNLLTKWLKADQARPSTFMQMISGWRDGAGQMLARQLESGELKQLRFMQRASEMFDPFTKENKEWLKKASGKNAEWITINGIDGVDAESNSHVSSISITPMMRVALFMHANNYDNMRHIAEGGIRIPDQKLYQQGKVDDAYNRGKRVVLQPTDLYTILGGSPKTGDLGSNMTDQEKAFAKILKQYMDGLSKEAINETSMELDGFERAMEANYYPIQTDRRYLKTPPDVVKHDISVENTGSIANERQHASNPIELRDATDTLAWHMEQTARYHGMAVPIRNLNAVYKYNFMRQPGEGPRYVTSVEDTIDNKWGGDATNYINQLMADLQGGQSAEQSTFGQISAKLRGKLAGATLTLNPSVALSQLASYPAALQQLGTGAMVRGLNLANRVDEKLIAAYTPLLWYRSQGNITDELNRDTLKMPKVLDWISDMDTLAIKRLWAASEAWVRMNTDLQKPESPAMDGSDPFYQRVAEKFNRVVWDTQPNYTTMQRTQLQRQGNELTKILAMYKTVPLQYYNMILEAQTRLKETSARAKAEGATDAEKKAYEDAKQFAARTHTGLLASNAFYVFIKTVIMNSLLRKRDDLKDDEGNKTPASIIEGLTWALAEVYAGSIIGSDVLMQAAKHLVKGDRFYGLELSSVSTINDMVEQGMNFGDVLKKVLSGTAELDDGLDAIHDAAAMTARLMGVPAENIEKWLLVATKWIAPEWANKYENLFDQIEKRDLKAGSSQKDLEAQISVLMENRTDDLQDETIEELARLWAAGYGNAIPTAIQNTATVNGEDITLTAKQKQAYRDAWSDPVSENLQDLMDSDRYQEADDEQRQKMISSLYDYARGKAKESALDVEPDAWIKAADESEMNLADYIAERVWLNSFEKTDEQTASEVKLEQLMAADMDDNLRAQTYKNVLASQSEKAALDAVGGTEEDQVEAVNVLYQIRTATATDEQTAAEQKRNAILESDLTKEQQAELYYNLLADKDGKAWIDNVTAAGDDKAEVVQTLMNFQNSSGTVEKIQTILDSDLSDKGKLEFYHKITKERDDRIETFKKAGLDLDDYLTITQKYSEINAGDESAGEKSTAFAKWLDDQKYTRNQIDTVKDEMGYYSMVRANSDKYDALTDAGLSTQNAQRIYESVNALKPEDGASQVSEIQKLETIGNSGLSAAQQLEAAKVYASDSSDRKLDVLDGYSVSVSQWAEFRSLYADYQEQYKGQKGSNQSAAKDAAMDVIGSNISTQAGREAAAALWQTADTGWKAKNNPFDVSTGEAIYNAMH